MKPKTIMGLALTLGVMLAAPVVTAGDDTVETMAIILVDLNHYPTDAQKETLKGIINDSGASEQERTVAAAMTNLNHKATSADKEKMKMIMEDEAAEAELRQVAGVIYRLNHKPSASDQELLAVIISE